MGLYGFAIFLFSFIFFINPAYLDHRDSLISLNLLYVAMVAYYIALTWWFINCTGDAMDTKLVYLLPDELMKRKEKMK